MISSQRFIPHFTCGVASSGPLKLFCLTPCRFFLIEREIPFPVRECSFYEDRRVASMEHMEEIAWRLRTLNPSRQVGFVSASQLHREQEEEESAEARLVRDEPSKHRD